MVESLFHAHERSCNYYDDNREVIRTFHNRKWIAIYGSKIVASEDSITKLLKYLTDHKISRELSLIRFVND